MFPLLPYLLIAVLACWVVLSTIQARSRADRLKRLSEALGEFQKEFNAYKQAYADYRMTSMKVQSDLIQHIKLLQQQLALSQSGEAENNNSPVE